MGFNLQGHPWMGTLLAALLAVAVAMVGRRIARAALGRLARGHPLVQAVLRATEGPGAAVFPLLALILVWQEAPADLAWLSSVRHLTVLLLIAGAAFVRNPWAGSGTYAGGQAWPQALALLALGLALAQVRGPGAAAAGPDAPPPPS